MEMLKKQIDGSYYPHGDIKDFFGFTKLQNLTLFQKKTKNKPENILVDYEDNSGIVSNFACSLADWGTAGNAGHYGGTPLYAGPRTYESDYKDIFSFGRLALELFLDRKGKSQHF